MGGGRWSKDATEFTVGLNYYEGREGCQSTIPKPVVDRLGLADRITFKVPGKSIIVLPGPRQAGALLPAAMRRCLIDCAIPI